MSSDGKYFACGSYGGRWLPIKLAEAKGLVSDDERNAKASGSTGKGGRPTTILDGNVVNPEDENPQKSPPGHGCGERGTRDLAGEKFPCSDGQEPDEEVNPS